MCIEMYPTCVSSKLCKFITSDMSLLFVIVSMYLCLFFALECACVLAFAFACVLAFVFAFKFALCLTCWFCVFVYVFELCV